MIRLRRATWAPPIMLGLLTVALLAAVIVARQSRAPLVAAAIHRAIAPSVARQRAVAPRRRRAFPPGTHTTYGPGLKDVVDSPVALLRPELGNEWRKLGQAVGRLLLMPSGTRSRYFEMSMAVVAPRRAGRLEILTSEGQRAIALVSTGAFQVITFGPLLTPAPGTPAPGRIGVALISVAAHRAVPGPDFLLSPLQAQYLSQGESVTRMPALAELGARYSWIVAQQ